MIMEYRFITYGQKSVILTVQSLVCCIYSNDLMFVYSEQCNKLPNVMFNLNHFKIII